MERYIGMDVHAASCTLAVISEKGRKLRDFPVETNGQALVEAVRMIPGRQHLIFEEGLQSAWLYETLKPHVDEIVVVGITTSRGPKSDKRDAYGLAEKLRVGSLDKIVFKAPRQFTRLRELSRIHMTLVGDTVRVYANNRPAAFEHKLVNRKQGLFRKLFRMNHHQQIDIFNRVRVGGNL